MALQLHQDFFQNKAEVLADIQSNDTWPTTFVSGPSEGLQVHWHAEEVHAYVLEGETDFLDDETGQRIPITAGDKLVIPARALHAEGAVKNRIVYILALPVPLETRDFLVAHSPQDR